MIPSNDKTYLFLSTTKDVWQVVCETYSDGDDSSLIFEIKMRLCQRRQGEKGVTEYYMEMVSLVRTKFVCCKRMSVSKKVVII